MKKTMIHLLGLITAFLVLLMPTASAETNPYDPDDAQNGIEITVNGIPISEALEEAAGMFSDAFEENIDDAIEGLKDTFGGFAEAMSRDLDEIKTIFVSQTEAAWVLNIPAIAFSTMITGEAEGAALDIYTAQINGETEKDGVIALSPTESCGNTIVYIFDESDAIPAIQESMNNDSFGETEIVFGREGYTGTYAVVSVLYMSPSDDPAAVCNMMDLSDEQNFEAYRDYVYRNAGKIYDDSLIYGDKIVTIIFWNEDVDADWLVVVAKEVPMLLE